MIFKDVELGRDFTETAMTLTREKGLDMSEAITVALRLHAEAPHRAPKISVARPDPALTLADKLQKNRKMDPSVAYQVAAKVVAMGGTDSPFAQKVCELLDAGVPHEEVLARANRETSGKRLDVGEATMRLRDLYPHEDTPELIRMAARLTDNPQGLAAVERQRKAGADIRTAVTVALTGGASTVRRHGPPMHEGISFDRPLRMGR
jgi:hypothetical protein